FNFDGGAMPTYLQDVATAGNGTSYETTNATELVQALESILRQLPSTCVLAIDDLPDPNRVWVTIDGTSLLRDTPNGYAVDGDGSTVVLQGTACELARNGATVEVVTGCAPQCMPTEEVCNWVDDDCDGELDEGC